VIETFVDQRDEFAVPLTLLSQFLNLDESATAPLVVEAPSIRVLHVEDECLCTSEKKWRRLSERLCTTLGEFHTAHPLAPGMDSEAARPTLPYRLTPR